MGLPRLRMGLCLLYLIDRQIQKSLGRYAAQRRVHKKALPINSTRSAARELAQPG
jgi:hypothetical protein